MHRLVTVLLNKEDYLEEINSHKTRKKSSNHIDDRINTNKYISTDYTNLLTTKCPKKTNLRNTTFQ